MKRYYKVDYDKLLRELQQQSNPQNIALEKQVSSPPTADEEDAAACAKRMRKKALQNPEIRYIYSKGKVHDKDCHYVKK